MLQVVIPDQVLPVAFSIRVQLTSSDLTFSPGTLSFGDCIIAERTELLLHLNNASALTQEYGFLDLPRGVKIEPNAGFGTILPGQSQPKRVTFTPEFAGAQRFTLQCTTLCRRTFSIAATANAVSLPLSFSHNLLNLAATALGDASSVSTTLRNANSEAQFFEFAIPQVRPGPAVLGLSDAEQTIHFQHPNPVAVARSNLLVAINICCSARFQEIWSWKLEPGHPVV